MSLALDHVVIAVSDLERAIADYTALGFTVLRGGQHPRGSVNALIVFEDGSYFELIAFPKPDQGFRWWDILERAGPGFVDYALLPDAIERQVEAARSRGLDIENPQDGGRLTPEGDRAVWKTARPATSDVPFLCGDVTPRALRVPEGPVRQHANKAQGISRITVAVRDLAASAGRYQALSGEAPEEASQEAVTFLCGGTAITFASSSAEGIGTHLGSRGEGPFSVALKLPPDAPAAASDRNLTHRAILELEG